MQDSITIAEVGSIVKVSGSRIATPLGPPRPGSTPTKMPSTSPRIIKVMIFQVMRTAKPCNSNPNASMTDFLAAERRFERALWHDDVEGDVEGHEHHGGEHEGGEERFPPCDLADHAHETGDQEEARDIEAEELRCETEQDSRHEHGRYPAELRLRNEGLSRLIAREECDDQAVEACAGKDDGEVEREITGLRAGRLPACAGTPVVVAECQRQRQQEKTNDDVGGAIAGDGRRIRLRRGRIIDDNFNIIVGHGLSRLISWSSSTAERRGSAKAHCAANPASVISDLFSASSSSRKLSIS